MTLHNDDDLQRAARVLVVDACDDWHEYTDIAENVLDAVLPAYTARVLREAADELDAALAVGIEPKSHPDWLRARADAMTPQQEQYRRLAAEVDAAKANPPKHEHLLSDGHPGVCVECGPIA